MMISGESHDEANGIEGNEEATSGSDTDPDMPALIPVDQTDLDVEEMI